jgi:hypothetical protein
MVAHTNSESIKTWILGLWTGAVLTIWLQSHPVNVRSELTVNCYHRRQRMKRWRCWIYFSNVSLNVLQKMTKMNEKHSMVVVTEKRDASVFGRILTKADFQLRQSAHC